MTPVDCRERSGRVALPAGPRAPEPEAAATWFGIVRALFAAVLSIAFAVLSIVFDLLSIVAVFAITALAVLAIWAAVAIAAVFIALFLV